MKIAVLAISLVLMYSPNLYADIAFVANFDGNWDLFTVSDNGSNPVQLTHTAYDEKDPCWSADRKTIVYAPSDGHLRLIDIDTAQSMIIAETEQKNHKISPFFSPDGNEIVFAQFRPPSEGDDTDLMIYNIQTGATRRFLDQYALQMWPSWSPDGAKIVYANMHCSDDCGKDCSGALGCRCQRKVARQLLMTHAFCQQPVWSPDVNKIAFSSDQSGNFDIWIVDIRDWKLEQMNSHPELRVNSGRG